MTHLLEVKNLKTQFKIDGKVMQVVNGVSYYINEGEIVSVVGESGCGKSVSQLSGVQLIPTPPGKIVGGEVIFEGVDLLKFKADSEQMRDIRGGKIGFVFQEPMTSLNPVLTVGQQIVESLILHLRMTKADARIRAVELIKMVGIPDAKQRIDDYPHQFSGGMRQRIMIAMALSCNPKLLIADEATTALDVTTQAQILEVLKNIVATTNTSLLIVTHNLGIVARYAQRIYVMYAGRVVESGTTKDIFSEPRHPYTIGLLKAVPRLDEPKGHKLVPIDGLPPDLADKSPNCAFLPRCPYRTEKCLEDTWPELKQVEGRHYAACYVNIQRKRLNFYVGEVDKTKHALSKTLDSIEQQAISARSKILEVKNLKMNFPMYKGILRSKVADLKVIEDVNFEINKGETLGLVGESGCGKTTVARCILRLYNPTEGQIIFAGQDIAQLPKNTLRPLRRKIQLIFQDPYSSLNPRQSAGSIVGEPLKIHNLAKNNIEYQERVAELFKMVGLDPSMKDRFPHEFSGGQRQRIGIARALASDPSVIVCDEPISALDVSIQAQIINLLEELQDKLGLTYLFIAHDLSVVRHISNRVAVMYLGRIVEITDWKSLYENPLHPYTKALLSAVPIPDPFVEEQRDRIILRGEVPSLLNRPSGCNFHPRCPVAKKECSLNVPSLSEVSAGHKVACLGVT
ncbi:MAG: ABC transporter ATP-binding protein [Clostridia bacterium]|nr:ABC transporter ATP-binding protein [Clostridia bacterium]